MARKTEKTPTKRPSTRKHATSPRRPAAGLSLEKLPDTKKLSPSQKQAVESLELGSRYPGRTFKRRGSPKDKPVARKRPPMPNESTRTDMDRHGDAFH